MRRTLIALAALGLVLGLTASPAHASGDVGECLIDEAKVLAEEGTPLAGLDSEDSEDVELATEAFEECEVVANPILPATNELIWGSLAFAVLFAVLAKYAYPPVKQAMADRTEKIREEVEQAERIREEAAAEETAREDALKEARTEATAHIETARREADTYRTAERAKVDADMVELRSQGQADVEASKQQALADLRGEVATLAIGAAEQVVGQNLDRAANERLVEDFIDRVGRGDGAS
jgi:F-type H+-transporting ATPase subunit b